LKRVSVSGFPPQADSGGVACNTGGSEADPDADEASPQDRLEKGKLLEELAGEGEEKKGLRGV